MAHNYLCISRAFPEKNVEEEMKKYPPPYF